QNIFCPLKIMVLNLKDGIAENHCQQHRKINNVKNFTKTASERLGIELKIFLDIAFSYRNIYFFGIRLMMGFGLKYKY
ncbi:MAG: hypothetical protein LUG24_10760, partial [Clostridiales bacterium]|nr:hypothetical protein [Clostridiales bacterium]